jgi:acetate kinase
MSEGILALNLGSSSIKLAVFDTAHLAPVARGAITDLGPTAQAAFTSAVDPSSSTAVAPPASADIREAIAWLLGELRQREPGLRIAAVGHRVVHGGTRFGTPVRIDPAVLAELEALAPLAPLHQPVALAAIRGMQDLLPQVPQVACFDTAFHHTQAKHARWFALPRGLSEAGVVRIGFHGLSYEYIAGALPGIAGASAHGKVVVAHLGHGASVCAMRGLRSVSTTMGFTPLDGLMMATRCGALDPGVLLYLQRQRGMTVEEVTDLLYNRSGLLGVSGISADVRALEASTDPRAHEALDMFAERAAAAIASQCVALDGLDVLVFTGGIGEHSAATRRRICARLRWLGIALDGDAILRHAQCISTETAAIRVFVIPTDEEAAIARGTSRLLGLSSGG